MYINMQMVQPNTLLLDAVKDVLIKTLFENILKGNFESLKTLLEQNPKLIDTEITVFGDKIMWSKPGQPIYTLTPLHAAILFNQTEIAEWLIEKSADVKVNMKLDDPYVVCSSLVLAVVMNNLKLVNKIASHHPEFPLEYTGHNLVLYATYMHRTNGEVDYNNRDGKAIIKALLKANSQIVFTPSDFAPLEELGNKNKNKYKYKVGPNYYEDKIQDSEVLEGVKLVCSWQLLELDNPGMCLGQKIIKLLTPSWFDSQTKQEKEFLNRLTSLISREDKAQEILNAIMDIKLQEKIAIPLVRVKFINLIQEFLLCPKGASLETYEKQRLKIYNPSFSPLSSPTAQKPIVTTKVVKQPDNSMDGLINALNVTVFGNSSTKSEVSNHSSAKTEPVTDTSFFDDMPSSITFTKANA